MVTLFYVALALIIGGATGFLVFLLVHRRWSRKVAWVTKDVLPPVVRKHVPSHPDNSPFLVHHQGSILYHGEDVKEAKRVWATTLGAEFIAHGQRRGISRGPHGSAQSLTQAGA